jgi:hypothetical protein
MPIVITPQGEYVDSETGNPVMNPRDPGSVAREGEINAIANMDMQRLDPRSVVREGEMARENIPSNMDMGMDSMMPQMEMGMDDIDKVRLLMDMGLNEQDAIEAVVREKSMGTVRPEEFSGQQMPTQQQQAPMPRPQMPTSPQAQAMGALPSAPPQRPFDLSGMSREQVDMVRRGIDPFAEGMVR